MSQYRYFSVVSICNYQSVMVLQIASSKAGIDTKRIREFVASYVAKVKAAQKRALAAKQHVIHDESSADVMPALVDT